MHNFFYIYKIIFCQLFLFFLIIFLIINNTNLIIVIVNQNTYKILKLFK